MDVEPTIPVERARLAIRAVPGGLRSFYGGPPKGTLKHRFGLPRGPAKVTEVPKRGEQAHYHDRMPFHATVVQVLVASPGDTQTERTAILTDTSRWNGP